MPLYLRRVKKGAIIRIIKNRVGKIAKLCDRISENFDPETIHKFRVSVKKLRALLRLLKIANDGKSPGLTTKFKNLYCIAGDIRDGALAMEKAKTGQLALPQYMELCHANMERHKQQWTLHYSKKILKRLEEKLTDYDYKQLHPNTLKDFLKRSFHDIANISGNALPGNNDIHRLRKIMKDMLYLGAFTDKEWEKAHKLFNHIPDEDLAALTDILGNFNDERLTMERLTDFALQSKDKREKDKIEHFCDREAAILIEKKRQIVATAKDFLHSAKKM